MTKFSAILLAAFLAISAHAGTVAVTAYPGAGLVGPSGDQLYGWFFNTTGAISVTALGVFDQDSDGLTESHDVGIFRVSDQSLVGSATVSAGTGGTLLDGFRYTSVTPFLLTADSYAIVMTIADNSPDGQLFQASSVTTSAPVVWTGVGFDAGSSLAYPTQDGSAFSVGMFGPNFQFDPAPEPGTTALFAIGGVALALLRRRKS